MKKTKAIYSYLIGLSLVLPFFCASAAPECTETKIEKEDNPFLDRDTELRYEDKDLRVIADMTLTAVFFSGDTSRAIIDGRIIKLGDIINNLEVTEIKSEKVYFKDYLGKEYTLEMLSILSAVKEKRQEEPGPTRY